jgi:NAD(P)-dependent dehydrogenase (short-subunit alcohol dehydrogenase family)
VADAREPSAANEAAEVTYSHFGKIDILVNNVGGTFPSPAAKISQGGWAAVMRLNLETAMVFSQTIAPAMLARGGSIVNVASVAGLTASPGAAHYGAAKAALINLTATLALEWGPRVRVNCVAPDFIRTEGTDKLMTAGDRRRMMKLVPLRRLGTPHDVANAVTFLASDMASFMTGQTLVIDGGSLHRGRLEFMPTER